MLRGNALRQLIEANFEVVRDRSSDREVVILCPESGCGDQSGNRSINLKSGKTNCWKCNVAGTFAVWAKRHGYHFDEDDVSGMSLEDMKNWKAAEASFLPTVREVDLPKGFTRMSDEPDSAYTRFITRMAKRKNLGKRDMLDAGVGFTREGRWEPYAIFPVFEDNVPVYWQGRLYSEEPGEKTKKFPYNDEVKYGARYWLYNIDELRQTRAPVVVVVEAILNVLSLKRFFREEGIKDIVAVAAFKHSVSAEQMLKLNQCRWLQEVVLLFDHDATDQSWRGSQKMANHLKVSVAEMPVDDGNNKLDPNDDVELAWDAIEDRVPYTSLNSKKQRYESLLNKGSKSTISGLRV